VNAKNTHLMFTILADSQSQNAVIATSSIGQLVINNSSNLAPLDFPWEEGVTENGERYYINHLTRTTTWRDPRLCMLTWEAFNDKLLETFISLPLQPIKNGSKISAFTTCSSSANALKLVVKRSQNLMWVETCKLIN
jgi:hypothetical protein